MVRRYRRYWCLPLLLVLWLPIAVQGLAPDSKALAANEYRELAAPPAWPGHAAGWLALPGQLDGYLRDHFGLRHAMIRGYARLTQHWLHAGNALVLPGRDDWLFVRLNGMVEESAGALRHDRAMAHTADVLATLQQSLAQRGIALLAAPPPNSATIYPDKLPDWAANPGVPTDYDSLLASLAARGIKAVDLRPALALARKSGKVYLRHDTHWTGRGALIGFNAVAQAAGHPDWQLDPAKVLRRPFDMPGGDLGRMLGIAEDQTETTEELALPIPKVETISADAYPTYSKVAAHPGPTIMVIGDSFTEARYDTMVLQHAGRFVWVFNNFCNFDRAWIDRFQPDEVWWMVTERNLACWPAE